MITKKFWEDWQEQIYKTHKIELTVEGQYKLQADGVDNGKLLEHLCPGHDDRILDATFFGDDCMMTIVKHHKKINSNQVCNKIIKVFINRQDIITVKYKSNN